MDAAPLLQVSDYSVVFEGFETSATVLRGINLKLLAGQVIALVGETGAGKSVLVQSVMRMLPDKGAKATGLIKLQGHDLGAMDEAMLRQVRGKEMGLVVTNPRARLNPVQSIGGQIVDAIAAHEPATAQTALIERAIGLLRDVGIPDPERRMEAYPHELSGGMCQRVVIAMAIANRPLLVLADEPTAGLDVTIQLQIMELLKRLVRDLGSGVLLVTRDLGIAAHFADEIVVMRAGEIVEHQPTPDFFAAPRDPYSRMLLNASRSLTSRAGDHSTPTRRVRSESVLKVEGLTKHFSLSRGKGFIYAVNDISFSIEHGETLALVGESGSGKTTTGRLVLGLTSPTAGRVELLGTDLTHQSSDVIRSYRPRMQIVFQEPSESLDPRFTIGRSIEEPLRYRGSTERAAHHARVHDLLDLVMLPRRVARLYPHQISAGQQQRAAIARAIATDPDLVILDEPTSSLDISVRGEILSLLRALQDELGISYLFISHDLSAVEQISHRIAIMYLGSIVEIGETGAIFSRQLHPYGRALISSVLMPDPEQKQSRLTLTGEIPSPVKRPTGCPLVGRCPIEIASCAISMPALKDVGDGHHVACHRVKETLAAGSIEALAAREGRLGELELVTR